MASPRFQCLNTTKQIVRSGLSSRAAFSTTRVAQADGPPRSSASEPLDMLPGRTPQSPEFQSRPRPALVNPIQTEAQRKPRINEQNANLLGMFSRSNEQRQRQAASQNRRATTAEEMQSRNLAQDLSKQITRRWRSGDIYAPHDLSEVEMAKWKTRSQPKHDVFDVLDMNPEEHYRNFSMISEYMTPMGRIKHSKETGLRPVNQRRIARAIRRAIGLGMHPSVHVHPEILHLRHERNTSSSPFRALTPSP
ncbi:uncharacterized protein RAG0_16214 [Rhynchosporium agropyri]|uniref:Small ribosomal subunit protein bS18m n=1 Tax=Rhynchosporium agropyri TaxID=914238 RepID=A0A1E1LPE6_9HELO|nr:uncharacterized protein RAG0_16214 [Rhynchosporium agropyri]